MEKISHSLLLLPPDFPARALVFDSLPSSPARSAAYLQPQDEASLTAFSTASRVSPVRL
jgi:hypothetical protein